MGERSAVRPKSGQSVSQSDPGLRRPTPPMTAGRKPAARPPNPILSFTPSNLESPSREAGLPQPKTGRGTGQNPVVLTGRAAPGCDISSSDLAALLALSDSELAPLIEYIRILDRWDKETHGQQTM